MPVPLPGKINLMSPRRASVTAGPGLPSRPDVFPRRDGPL